MTIRVKEKYGEKRRIDGLLSLSMKGEATLIANIPGIKQKEVYKLSRARVEYIIGHGMLLSGIDVTQTPPLYQEWECRYPKEIT